MDNRLRSLSYVILFASLSAVSALGIIGFLNNAYAVNTNTNDSMNMNANMTTNGKMSFNATASVTANGNMSMTNMHKILSPLQQLKSGVSANVTANGNMSMTNMHKILSPLQQFQSGVSAKSVQCNQGFTLVIKISDGSPACVSSQTAQALTARGWGTTP